MRSARVFAEVACGLLTGAGQGTKTEGRQGKRIGGQGGVLDDAE